jgi:DNA-binding GntR family transcriptional regulator
MTQRPKGQLLDQTVSIDRSSYEPAYAQLGNILRQSMASGVLRPGDQLPSEAQLCERYGLSPMTVRQPVLYHREYLIYDPTRPIVEAELEVTALSHLFNGKGETILKRGGLNLEATLLDVEEARLLQVEQPNAAFCLEHLFYDFDDKLISWGWFIVRRDLLRFTTQVGLMER